MNEKLALANALVGFLLPHAIALVNQQHWGPRLKAAVAFAACAAAGTLTSYLAGALTPGDIVLSALTIFGAAQVSYQQLWRPTGITTAIEQKTTVTEPGHDGLGR